MSNELNEPVNPYQAPSPSNREVVELSKSEAEFSIPALSGNTSFTLRGHSDRLQMIEATGKILELPRTDPLFSKLVEGNIFRNSLRLKLDKTYLLKLEPDDFATLKSWIGPPTTQDLKEAVGGKSWWQLILAPLFLISIPGSSVAGAAYNGIVVFLLVALWALGRFKPARWLFILTSVLFLIFACSIGSRVYTAFMAQQSLQWWNVVFLIICLNVSWYSIRQFRAYRILRQALQTS